MPDAYVPLTMDGNIMVDGVLASWYASFDHDLAHIVMAPMRMFPEIFQWAFGMDNENPGFVNIAKDMGRWMMPFTNQK